MRAWESGEKRRGVAVDAYERGMFDTAATWYLGALIHIYIYNIYRGTRELVRKAG